MTLPVKESPNRREFCELQARVNLLLAMASRADVEIAHLRDNLSQRDAEVVDLHGNLQARTIEVESLERSVADLSQSLAALHASACWRLTAPLRWMTALLRR